MTGTPLPGRIDLGDGVVLDLLQVVHAQEMIDLIDTHRDHFAAFDPFFNTNRANYVQVAADIRKAIERNQSGAYIIRGIWCDDKLVGRFMTEISGHQAEIGYWLAPTATGRGIVTRIGELMIKHLFEELGLVRIWAKTDPENGPSRRVLDRLGMSLEGVLVKDKCIADEVYRDRALYAVTR